MSALIIRKAFEMRLKAWADTLTLPVAFEGVSFVPPANGKYLRSYLLPAATECETLDGLHREYAGIYQVTVVQPLNSGTAVFGQYAAAIDAVFPVSFVQDGLRIFITTPFGAGQIVADDSLMMSIRGIYRAEVYP